MSAAIERLRGGLRRVGTGESPLTWWESIGLITMVMVGIALEAALTFASSPPAVEAGIASVLATLCFALFTTSPKSAVTMTLVLFISSLVSGTSLELLLALALTVAMVVRTGTIAMITASAVIFVAANALVSLTFTDDDGAHPAVSLLIAAAASTVALLLRASAERGERLTAELEALREQEQNAVREERLRIADELHDVIAHDLTIISMHAALLGDDRPVDMRREAREAIAVSARRALGDLRRVIDQSDVEAGAIVAGVELQAAVDDVTATLSAAGCAVHTDGDPTDARLPRMVQTAFARALREAATNILKHADAGPVRIRLSATDQQATLHVTNRLPDRARAAAFDSGGHGTLRQGARARALGGTFHAGPAGDEWHMSLSCPLSITP